VYGMLNRSNKKFEDARKAFLNAIKQDRTNINVWRDLAILQLQLNDLEGHCESRREMMVANPKIFAHFTGFYTAAFMVKKWDLCNEIWESISDMYAQTIDSFKGNEINEMYLLRARTFYESGFPYKGIKFIAKYMKFLTDDLRRTELLAKLYLAVNKTKEAVLAYEELVRLNDSNPDYFEGILSAEGVDMADDSAIVGALSKYDELLPKCTTHKRLILDLIKASPDFEERLQKYMRPMVIKGVPSLITELRSLYKDEAKVKIIGEQLAKMLQSMEK